MTSKAKILVVDDEANIRSFLDQILTNDGYTVQAVESGEAALELIPAREFDLALIDLNLAGIGGMDVIGALSQQSPDTVVIILTAYASLDTAVEALRHGAHDYLFKPCKSTELRESVRKGLLNRQSAIQQRNLLSHLEQMTSSLEDIHAAVTNPDNELPATPGNASDTEGRFLQLGGLIVDFLRHVITVDGRLLELSPTEFDLLTYLIRQAPRVISPQELMREVQGYDTEQWEASETVRQHVRRLRQKIKKSTGRTDVVRTVRGVGYTVDDE